MQRRLLMLALICFFQTRSVLAQDFKLLNRDVQFHGFATQGFVYTNHNNWLTMNTTSGSFAMTDMGLNVSSQLTDRLRVGAQVYDRNLGQLGQWHPGLDWAIADYRFRNWLGIRAGKVKTVLGLYNDSQDLDSLRVFAMLPQGVYPTDIRDSTIAHEGGDVYGEIDPGHRLGQFSYTGYVGYRNDSIYSGYPYLMKLWQVNLRNLNGLQYGGDLRWNTPLKGLQLGVSRMNQHRTAQGTFVNLLNPSAGVLPYQTSSTADWINQFFGEYLYRRLRLDAEYRRFYTSAPYLPGSNTTTDVRAWYVAGSYRVGKHVELGSYYSSYTIRSASTGAMAVFATPQDPSLPQNHIHDKVLAARFDLNRFVYAKVEGHFMDGYGLGPYPDGFYPQQNLQGFNPNTNALVVKTGFHF